MKLCYQFMTLLLVLGIAGSQAVAAPLTPGSLLLVATKDGNRFYEYSPEGVQLQMIELPGGGARSVAVDKNGHVQIYNGTFSPTLTTYDPYAETFTNTPYTGWGTINNVTYGGMATYGDYVYMTDMSTAYSGGPQGVVRYNVDTQVFDRFATNLGPIDLNIGLDGLLYTLSRGSAYNGGGNRIDVFDPITMAPIRSLGLPGEFRAIAVDTDGNIYGNGVKKFDPNGNLISQAPLSHNSSLDLHPDGGVLSGGWQGDMNYSPDMTFSNVVTITVSNNYSGNGSAAFNVLPQGNLLPSDPANASFSDVSDVDTLSLDFGSILIGDSSSPIDFDIANLFASSDQRLLDLINVSGSGDTGTLTTNLASFSYLPAGDSLSFTASFDEGAPGDFSASYDLSFTDAAGTDQTLTLNLTGEVALPDFLSNASFAANSDQDVIDFGALALNDPALPISRSRFPTCLRRARRLTWIWWALQGAATRAACRPTWRCSPI